MHGTCIEIKFKKIYLFLALLMFEVSATKWKIRLLNNETGFVGFSLNIKCQVNYSSLFGVQNRAPLR
jgi:hypothetical protein